MEQDRPSATSRAMYFLVDMICTMNSIWRKRKRERQKATIWKLISREKGQLFISKYIWILMLCTLSVQIINNLKNTYFLHENFTYFWLAKTHFFIKKSFILKNKELYFYFVCLFVFPKDT